MPYPDPLPSDRAYYRIEVQTNVPRASVGAYIDGTYAYYAATADDNGLAVLYPVILKSQTSVAIYGLKAWRQPDYCVDEIVPLGDIQRFNSSDVPKFNTTLKPGGTLVCNAILDTGSNADYLAISEDYFSIFIDSDGAGNFDSMTTLSQAGGIIPVGTHSIEASGMTVPIVVEIRQGINNKGTLIFQTYGGVMVSVGWYNESLEFITPSSTDRCTLSFSCSDIDGMPLGNVSLPFEGEFRYVANTFADSGIVNIAIESDSATSLRSEPQKQFSIIKNDTVYVTFDIIKFSGGGSPATAFCTATSISNIKSSAAIGTPL